MINQDSLVELNNVYVDLPIYNSSSRSFRKAFIKSAVGGLIRTENSIVTVRALSDVSFNLKAGDRLGISGHNGAGKTTLLRVLAGAYFPTQGTINIQGKVVSFIDIMLGMDVEYSGEENIYIRGLLYGLKKSEIKKKFDDIVAFSGLEEFIKLPMRTYSSGMTMRLAFSIATAIEADVILMDEWMSVGDKDFSEKAKIRLKEYLENVSIMVIASHSPELLAMHCNKRMLLTNGTATTE